VNVWEISIRSLVDGQALAVSLNFDFDFIS